MSHTEGVRVGNQQEMEFEPEFCKGCQRPYCSGPCLSLRNKWMNTEEQIEEAEQ